MFTPTSRIIAITVIIAVLGAVVWAVLPKKPSFIHYHAGFKVYIDGVPQDYSDVQYMSESPCVMAKPDKHVFGKIELYDLVGDVAHVHTNEATWMDLINYLNVQLPQGRSVAGYRNGIKVADILNQKIKPYDSVIILIGDAAQANINGYVSDNHIRAVETATLVCHN